MALSAESEAGDETRGRTAKGSSERRELGRREATAARRTAEAMATIPHLYAGLRLNGADPGAEGVAATLAAAAGRALAEIPELNATYRDGGLELHSRINVGVVLELDDGPLSPTLFDADRKSAAALATELAGLDRRARAGELASPDLAGGTFTISTLDSGAEWLAPAVTPGQTGHLAAGPLRDGTLDLTLAWDGRAVRPPRAADFLDRLAAALGIGSPGSGER